MYPPPRLRNKTLPAFQILHIVNTLEERLSMLSRGMGDIKDTQIAFMEMRMTMSQTKNSLDRINAEET